MRLVPFGPEHLDALRGFIGDPEIQRFTRVPVPTPDDFPDLWLAMYERAREDGSREAFAALDGGELVGLGFVPTIDRDAGEAELGYLVAPGHRGRGVGAAILRELTVWAFAQGLERCELYIDVRNPASEAVARRAGYTLEGTLRSVHHRAGERIDATVWSRLPADPEP
jgi:[ribosomal protein S5]-alanine N-acetyltransferase